MPGEWAPVPCRWALCKSMPLTEVPLFGQSATSWVPVMTALCPALSLSQFPRITGSVYNCQSVKQECCYKLQYFLMVKTGKQR